MITVKKIVEEYLKKHGYDGLCCDACGCTVNNLSPCCEISPQCNAGHIVHCDCGDDCDFHILPFDPPQQYQSLEDEIMQNPAYK